MKHFLTSKKTITFMRQFWKLGRWFWITGIVGIAFAYIANVLSSGSNEYLNNFFNNQVIPGLPRFLFVFRPFNILIDTFLIILTILTIASIVYSIVSPEPDPVNLLAKSIEELNSKFGYAITTFKSDIDLKNAAHELNLKAMGTAIDSLVDNHKTNLQAVSSMLQSTVSSYTSALAEWEHYLQNQQQNMFVNSIEQITQNLKTLSQQLQSMEEVLKKNAQMQEQQDTSITPPSNHNTIKQPDASPSSHISSLEVIQSGPRKTGKETRKHTFRSLRRKKIELRKYRATKTKNLLMKRLES